jgi:aspartate-semialdehyde dehydrogenase
MVEHHPWFEVAWLAASDRSEGKVYSEAARWRLKTPFPPAVAKMIVSPATPEGAPKIIFAALDASIAAELEPRFADAGCAVVSNSSALRMQEDVPLVIPEVNGGHIKLIDGQAWRKKSGGYVVTNPNCSAIGRSSPPEVRSRNRHGRHHAGRERRRIPGCGVARHSRQCHPLHPQ